MAEKDIKIFSFLLQRMMMSGGESAPTNVSSVLATGVMDFDSTVSESYGGSGQEWTDLINSNTFFFGEDGTTEASIDPSFTGSAGDSGAYFDFEGDRYFTIGSNTDLINQMHHYQRRDWSFICCFRYNPSGGAYSPISTGGANTSDDGFEVLFSNTFFRMNITNDGGRVVNGDFASAGVTAGDDVMIAFSYNSSTNVLTAFRGNDTTGDTASGALSNDSGVYANSSDPLRTIRTNLGVGGGVGSRWYHFSLYDGQMSSSDFIALKSFIETRHGGRTYT